MPTPAESRRLVAGNWKMNLTYQEGRNLALACIEGLRSVRLPVVFCPPAIHLNALNVLTESVYNVYTGAQDLSPHANGAHTGDLSGEQLKSVGCTYVIVGHSERRADYGEAGEVLAGKVRAALDSGLKPIYCFGETLEQREGARARDIVSEQLAEGLAQLDEAQLANVVLAYEPVWAIGTGKTASAAQAQEMHAHIRAWLVERFGESPAAATTILYGGSVKAGNAAELFAQPDIDGGLIGGASLVANDFVAIVNAFG